MKQENIEHARFRALAQIMINQDKGVEAFEEYMKIAFPYLEATKRRHSESVAKMIDQEIKRGAFAITAQAQPVLRSKMKSKIAARKEEMTKKQANDLYGKMGRSIPT